MVVGCILQWYGYGKYRKKGQPAFKLYLPIWRAQEFMDTPGPSIYGIGLMIFLFGGILAMFVAPAQGG